MTLFFYIENSAFQTIKEYEFLIYIEGVEIEIDSIFHHDNIGPYDTIIEEVTVTKDTYASYSEIKVDELTYEKILGTNIEDLNTVTRMVYLQGEDGVLVNNDGWTKWAKIILILAVSMLAGILVINKAVKVTWIRLILKLLCIPAIIIILVFCMVFLAGGDRKSSESARARSSDDQYRSAKQRYDRAAKLKSGAIMTGNTHSAAKAQQEMDWAMADMITAKGSRSSAEKSAAAKYKRQATLKAGATITGQPSDAARAQSEMDKAMADMIRGD